MKAFALILIVLVCLSLGWLLSQKEASVTPEPSSSKGTLSASSALSYQKSFSKNEFSSLFEQLEKTADPAEASALLTQVREKLDSLSPEKATKYIENYFASNQDAQLASSFKVSKNGQLETAPTLRTALLDHLASINPEAAATLYRDSLAEPTSADEWALALRNLARVEPDARDFLIKKTEELIRNPSWQIQPSIGYLNAFDTLAYVGATESTPLLSELVQRKDRQDLAHASFLTLDRLTLTNTETMLSLIANDLALQQSRPEMASQQLARADFRHEAQRQIIREWLLSPERTSTQLHSFAGTFPSGNMMISNNLLTTTQPFSGSELRDRDLRSLETIDTWLHLPEFEPIKEHLETMSRRLTTFVNQAESSPQ